MRNSFTGKCLVAMIMLSLVSLNSDAGELPERHVYIGLEISANGQVNFGGLGFSLSEEREFKEELHRIKSSEPGAIVELHVHKDVPYEVIRHYLELVQKAGLKINMTAIWAPPKN